MYCRFTQHYTWQQIYEFLNVIGAPQNLQPRHNIAPTTLVDMVRYDAARRINHTGVGHDDPMTVDSGKGMEYSASALRSLEPWFDKTWKPGDFELVE